MNFCNTHRPAARIKYPRKNAVEMVKYLASKWRQLTDEQKAQYKTAMNSVNELNVKYRSYSTSSSRKTTSRESFAVNNFDDRKTMSQSFAVNNFDDRKTMSEESFVVNNFDDNNGECFWRPTDSSDSTDCDLESSSEFNSSDDETFIKRSLNNLGSKRSILDSEDDSFDITESESSDDEILIKRNLKNHANRISLLESEDDMFENENKYDSIGEDVKSVSWTCEFCTFINTNIANICEICENPNQSASIEINTDQCKEINVDAFNQIEPEKSCTTKEDTEDARQCVVCYDSNAVMIILPCFHLCLCEKCTKPFMKSSKVCPKCRVKYKKIKKTF